MTEEQGAAIKDFVNAGNGLYALHDTSDISNTSKNFRDVMGGTFIGHPPLRPFVIRPTANKHPITDGITEFMVNDEQHFVTYDKDPKYVILEAENTDGLRFQALAQVDLRLGLRLRQWTRCIHGPRSHQPCAVGAAIFRNPKAIDALAAETDLAAGSIARLFSAGRRSTRLT